MIDVSLPPVVKRGLSECRRYVARTNYSTGSSAGGWFAANVGDVRHDRRIITVPLVVVFTSRTTPSWLTRTLD